MHTVTQLDHRADEDSQACSYWTSVQINIWEERSIRAAEHTPYIIMQMSHSEDTHTALARSASLSWAS